VKYRLNSTDRFVNRHIGPDAQETREMLDAIGVDSLETLIDQTVPADIRLKGDLNLPAALTEYEYLRELKQVASQNKVFRTYIGLGYYNNITPNVILRNVFENPGWYTQYTPYQAEIAQGRLEALLNYQTMVSDLTGLPIANASLLDEGTAAAEAMTMLYGARPKAKANADTFLVSKNALPQTIDLLRSRALPLELNIEVVDEAAANFPENAFGILLQYPDANGSVNDYKALVEKAHANNVFVVMATDLLALTLLSSPGELGADVAVGNSQRFGVPMGFGGPHAAFFACKDEYKRQIPGRIIGVSVDANGNRALRMALQTREQHIRREKATSNICTAQALLAIMASMYGVYHGPDGLKAIATRVHHQAVILDLALGCMGYKQLNANFFDTLTYDLGEDAITLEKIQWHALEAGINFRYHGHLVSLALDESTLPSDVKDIITVFAKAKGHDAEEYAFTTGDEHDAEAKPVKDRLPESLVRTSEYLTHPIFNHHHSESLMMRYIKSLENKDLSLTHSMIPLGSCTMKLNAATELKPVSWPEFGAIHPFVPADQVKGYMHIITELEQYLNEITGFAATSLQPNSGAQGEYAGLLVIRAYQKDRGEAHRNIVLIPSSAHGTNPASRRRRRSHQPRRPYQQGHPI